MLSMVSGVIGIVAALTIVLLIRRDHLHVRFGLFWMSVAAAFVVLGFFPTIIDWLALQLGVASGPILALTLGLTIFVLKLLTVDIARSKNEARIVRLVQRIGMLESEVRALKEGVEVEATPDSGDAGARNDPP